MTVIYTSKAKDDLARINWRVREKIITTLSDFSEIENARRYGLKQLHGSSLVKTKLEKYVIVSEAKGRELNVLSVIKEQKIKPSGVRFIET